MAKLGTNKVQNIRQRTEKRIKYLESVAEFILRKEFRLPASHIQLRKICREVIFLCDVIECQARQILNSKTTLDLEKKKCKQ